MAYDQEFDVGTIVEVIDDQIDGSLVGCFGRVVDVEWNDGGLFEGPRWIYRVLLDDDDDGQTKAEIQDMIDNGHTLYTSDELELVEG